MIFTITLVITLIIASVSIAIIHQKIKTFNFARWLLPLVLCFFTFSIYLMFISANDISESLIRQSWPSQMASIISTEIIGERAYSPQLKCEYQVEGKVYILTTDLRTPGFGRKKTRRQTSQIILEEYSEGSKVQIRYNPENPEEAYIRTGPYWSDYLKISLSVVLSSIGLIGIVGIIINKINLK